MEHIKAAHCRPYVSICINFLLRKVASFLTFIQFAI